MSDLFLTAFVFALFVAGLRKPFVWVLAYVYIDVLAPQKISWFLLQKLPISLIAFGLAFLGWAYADAKNGGRLTFRQILIAMLLAYCGATTIAADFPADALAKWDWVWKALVFAIFLPLTLRTRLRIEATALVMTLTAGAIIIPAGIKTLISGGGYGSLHLLVNDNVGLYEGSILSTVAIAIIPLALWLAGYGTIFRPDWRVKLFAWALCFACALMPVGTEARTGLVCLALLIAMSLRDVKRRVRYVVLIVAAGLLAVPFLPPSFTQRMETIGDHQADQSASTRLAVWQWTIGFANDHPFGGGFEAYRQNKLSVELVDTKTSGNTTAFQTTTVQDKARAYHSAYFEMLGEQGYPGLTLWLLLHILGVWQMERIYRRHRRDPDPDAAWIAPLASALQRSQIVYLVGSGFVGIAFQPFCYMIVALQCGLWSWTRRRDSARAAVVSVRPGRRDATAPPTGAAGVA
ncbi:putative O-glycosylation ligase, exosortase A system-associated [Novosphingobium sp. Gsoil 351]|uniref:putative O-glycosylation ligase, exosortase A system-associated n=1 Tax=Novosphingobium sp. Gsoil 351 TaxID=2675225 RepID=UPI0012B49E6F|nr:putative O-glycosylation ligase, exosortase A system-associated [Novosphingobium sp. Gsoil 351]QGN54725.1 putative O-glycosylation ligase, exosortase A system-associated [Novosphingobium sp. Gsoil 351]